LTNTKTEIKTAD